jgi:hypothetical protein
MTIRRINEELAAGKLLPVVFPFPPAKVPVDDSLNVSSTGPHILYSALVWLVDEAAWGILEFDQTLHDALTGYAFRNGGMQKLECLLSRYTDGSLRINAGRILSPAIDVIGEGAYNEMRGRAERLRDRYLKFEKYTFMV